MAAIQKALARSACAVTTWRCGLIAPAYTIGISDGQLNGTPKMRFSLIGRELVTRASTCI